MRFASYLVSLALMCLCSMKSMAQTVEPGQKKGGGKESRTWEGSFADGTPLTQKRLEELVTTHQAWLTGAKVREDCAKVKQAINKETCISDLLASDWGADQGRLVLKGAKLASANLKGAKQTRT